MKNNSVSTEPSHLNKWNVVLIIFAISIAICLFNYGIHIPFEFRLRGDAFGYMDIARQFASFHDALSYVDLRSPGFPLFDYIFLYLDTNSSMLARMNHISLTLLIIHELTSLCICFVCIKLKLLKSSSIYLGFLFLILAAYPAMVMHTTTPLTDTFGMDLLLIGFSLFAWVIKRQALVPLIFLGLLSGVLLGYAILVRPAYWIGVVGFLAIYMFITGVNYFLSQRQDVRSSVIMGMMSILALAAVTLPVMDHCKTKYHTICLQQPATFDSLSSVSAGLSSARTVWSYTGEGTPFYPESFLVKHFQHRCPITSITGSLTTDNTNLVSCMYHAPHLTVIYFAKKITGLFDTFRLTPYTELLTPTWYIWLARAFSSIAFAGFWILLWDGCKATYQLVIYRRPVSPLIAAIWIFCIIQVAVHSILHVEERYAFPWLPFCIIAFLLKIKTILDDRYPAGSRKMWLIFITLSILGYFIQVLVWDSGLRYHIG